MEYRIAHACGHEQAHYLSGFASQMDRKAAWLRTTKCRTCFVADKQTEQANAAASDNAAVSHLELPPLSGSDRQISWASTIRVKRLAAIAATTTLRDAGDHHPCVTITEAKWWIDCRDLGDADLLAKAETVTRISGADEPIMILTPSA